jgi:Myb-like DNA-binding domain
LTNQSIAECAKRWTDTLNPAIDRTTWTPDAVSSASLDCRDSTDISTQDEILLRAVEEHGKVWTKIVKTYFPGRTGLSAKNRFVSPSLLLLAAVDKFR